MAPEPSLERLRLLIESEDEEDFDPIKDPPPIGALQRRPEDMMDNDAERSGRLHRFGVRRVLPIGLALLALVSFGAIVWEAYNWGTGTTDVQEVPIIHADSEPIKTRPAEPGGLDVPHQDKLVLNEITPDPAQPQVERLLPPPEVPRPPAPAATVALPESDMAPAGEAGKAEAEGQAAARDPAPESGTEVAAVQPAPDPSAEAEGTTAAAAEPPAAAAQEPASDAAPAASSAATESFVAEPVTEAPRPPAPAAADPAPAAEEAQTAEAAAPAEPAKPESAESQTAAVPASGAFLVQLGALKSRAGAEREWGRLTKAFPELLGDRASRIQSVDVAGKGTFHRVQAGYFADRASAAALCARFKARKQDCIVARR